MFNEIIKVTQTLVFQTSYRFMGWDMHFAYTSVLLCCEERVLCKTISFKVVNLKSYVYF